MQLIVYTSQLSCQEKNAAQITHSCYNSSMYLHEAVRKARKDMGLSQVKLAEMAGIQRKQLATLENGGNVTLTTIRKVVSQLPNLEVFSLEGVQVDARTSPKEAADKAFSQAMSILSETFGRLAARAREGGYPTPGDIETFRAANEMLTMSNQLRRAEVDQDELLASGKDMLLLDPREVAAAGGAVPVPPPETMRQRLIPKVGFSPTLARAIARRAKAGRSAR